MPVKPDVLSSFMSLFQGSQRSFGQWIKTDGRMFTEKKPPTAQNFRQHLNGVQGIGIVPIARDKYSYFGAIDIEKEDLDRAGSDPAGLEGKVRELQLPLVTCRSKSGGAHLYYFREKPILTPAIRAFLSDAARLVGFPKCEIFPKQNEVSDSVLGNWINLPYFNAEKTERYFIQEGLGRPIGAFIQAAQLASVVPLRLTEDHPEAPPCIQSMLGGQVPEGQRNEALYAISVYLKKRYGDEFKQYALDANARFTKPLEHSEAKKTVSSVARRDYKYKCQQEPCKGLCDSNVCLTREFGITPEEGKELAQIRKPGFFSNLQKYMSEPVYWRLDVEGQTLTVSTAVLMEFGKLRAAIADAHTRLIPKMKDADWHIILGDLMEHAELIDTPDEASVPGQVRAKLREFTSKVVSNGHIADRKDLLRGMPIVEERFDRKVVYFRGQDFIDWLKKSRSEDLKGVNLWLALRQAGVDYARIKVNDFAVNVWYVDLNEEGELEFQPKKFEPEF